MSFLHLTQTWEPQGATVTLLPTGSAPYTGEPADAGGGHW